MSADSREASCQLLAKEWALNTGKLPPGDCLNMTSAVYHGCKAPNQTNKQNDLAKTGRINFNNHDFFLSSVDFSHSICCI